jgi:lactoylglutathione lyase
LKRKREEKQSKYMKYLHTMVRVRDVDEALDFYCTKLGLVEVLRKENEAGRFTLIFLAAADDVPQARAEQAPLLELTYNWPTADGRQEAYAGGRNFGHLAYRVDNIYETCRRLQEAGVTINRPPRDGRMAFIKSPDGISVELLQAGEALPPQAPWCDMANEGAW